MHEREFTALSRWIAEYGGRDDADELAPLARRLDQLLRTDEGDEERNWQQLARSAERLSSRGEIARVRAGSRGLVALLRGDHAAISAFVTEHSIAERPPHDDRTGRSWGSPSSRQLRIAALVATTSVVLLAGGVELAKALTTPALTVTGPAHDAQIGAPRVDSIAFVARGTARELGKERWVLDGRNVDKDVVTKPGEFVFRPNDLIEGVHELEVSLGGGFLGASAHKRFKFVVDLTPPSLQVTRSAKGISWQPIEVHGTAEEGSSVKVDGKSVALEHGDFSARVQPPVPARVSVVATDPAGNTARSFVSVTLVPRHVVEPIRAVHLTADAWANSELRGQALKLIAQHRVNTIELDLKDEGGIVGFSGVAAANRMGATRPIYNLAAAVNELHAMGVRVIGRLVCFSDPLAASVLWRTGHRDEVVQTPDHKPYAGYGGFTNFANPTVRRYEISIAVAAAKDGVDDVLYDYVRRPDGPISSMVFPGLKGSPSAAIVEFLRETKIALRPYHTYLGASVFGIAATRPDQVAQDIPAMARDLDYVSPMVYPSHWNNGEYDVADPNEEPYLIVKRSLVDFKHDVAGSGARLVPWLQDFSLGVTYGPAQVRAQIAAARSDGVNEFLLWNAGAVYDAGGLAPDAPRAAPLKPADG